MSDKCEFCLREFSLHLVPNILSCKCLFCSSCCNYFRSIELQKCPFENHEVKPKTSKYEGKIKTLNSSTKYSKNSEDVKECKARLSDTLKNLKEIILQKKKIKEHMPSLSKAQNIVQNSDLLSQESSSMKIPEKLEFMRKSKIFQFEEANAKIINNLTTKVPNDLFKAVYNSFFLREKLKFIYQTGILWAGSSIVCEQILGSQKVLVKIPRREQNIVAGIGIYTGKYKGRSPILKRLTIHMVKKPILDYEVQEHDGEFFEIPYGKIDLKSFEYI